MNGPNLATGDRLTSRLVADQLARIDVAARREQTANLFLGHGLRQVVDNQIGLAVLERVHRRVAVDAAILVDGRRCLLVEPVHGDRVLVVTVVRVVTRVRGVAARGC